MLVNESSIQIEVLAAAMRYENALVNNHVQTLDELFWNSDQTVRYGATEMLYGAAEIAAFRKSRNTTNLSRTIRRIQVTTFGTDFATVNLEFERRGQEAIGRQSQFWVRMPEGWRIVSAHVSNVSQAASMNSEGARNSNNDESR
ncbi:MAG: oxalurate catabolism protein HpxZ [Hyphomicrobiales bacterium]